MTDYSLVTNTQCVCVCVGGGERERKREADRSQKRGKNIAFICMCNNVNNVTFD